MLDTILLNYVRWVLSVHTGVCILYKEREILHSKKVTISLKMAYFMIGIDKPEWSFCRYRAKMILEISRDSVY